MCEQGVRGLVVYCLNHCCHRTIVNVDEWPHEVEDASFGLSMFQVPRRRVEVRLNWKGGEAGFKTGVGGRVGVRNSCP